MKRLTSSVSRKLIALAIGVAFIHGGCTEPQTEPILRRGPEHKAYVQSHYTKAEYNVPMRDGVKLHTSVYAPRDTTRTYPVLMLRTPYSCRPYGEALRSSLGPSALLAQDGYIFVYQDVRGCYLSEGQFVNMRPHIDGKRGPEDIDESTDTYDTIEWLMANVDNQLKWMDEMWDITDTVISFITDSREMLWSEVDADLLEETTKGLLKDVNSKINTDVKWCDAFKQLSKTIKNYRPVIFVENNTLEQSKELITSVVTDQSVMLAVRFLAQWLLRHAQSQDSMLVRSGPAPSSKRRARRAR